MHTADGRQKRSYWERRDEMTAGCSVLGRAALPDEWAKGDEDSNRKSTDDQTGALRYCASRRQAAGLSARIAKKDPAELDIGASRETAQSAPG